MPELALAAPVAHVGHWSHLLLYLIPVVAVLVAIFVSGRKTRRLESEARAADPEDGDDGRSRGEPS